MVLFETPSGRRGPLHRIDHWCDALSYDDYANNVSTITENVVDHFLSPEPYNPPLIP